MEYVPSPINHHLLLNYGSHSLESLIQQNFISKLLSFPAFKGIGYLSFYYLLLNKFSPTGNIGFSSSSFFVLF